VSRCVSACLSLSSAMVTVARDSAAPNTSEQSDIGRRHSAAYVQGSYPYFYAAQRT
jgi:hypothetical protein